MREMSTAGVATATQAPAVGISLSEIRPITPQHRAMTARGLTHAQAIAYVGVKRRTFDEVWRPHLRAIKQGSCLIFDKVEVDQLFDRFMTEACSQAAAPLKASTDGEVASASCSEQNQRRNGRPISSKGEHSWANRLGASTPKKTERGKLTSGGDTLDFVSVASSVLKKRKGG